MTQHLVGVFFNLQMQDKYFGYKPDHPLAFVGDLLVEAESENEACGKAWSWAQRADGMNATEGVAYQYRGVRSAQGGWITGAPTGDVWLDDLQMPSLSVGDVFLVDLGEGEQRADTGTWYATASIGFTKIPKPKLIDWQPGSISARITVAIEDINQKGRNP